MWEERRLYWNDRTKSSCLELRNNISMITLLDNKPPMNETQITEKLWGYVKAIAIQLSNIHLGSNNT